MARMACRYELFPQFLWSSQQAIEKYLKAILLYNRVKATRIGHDIQAAMLLTQQLPFSIELSTRSEEFLDHLARCGENRYIDVPYFVKGYALIDLDLSVWEIRRYCQVLHVSKDLPENEETLLAEAQSELAAATRMPRHKFKLRGGFLEKVLADRKHPSRAALLWQNGVFGVRKRQSVLAKHHLHAQNPMLFLYPEMLVELLKYVFVPKKLASAYRDHLAEIQSNPDARP